MLAARRDCGNIEDLLIMHRVCISNSKCTNHVGVAVGSSSAGDSLVASSRLCMNKVTNNNNSTLKLISKTEYAVGGHVA
jgi:hypothetical protein